MWYRSSWGFAVSLPLRYAMDYRDREGVIRIHGDTLRAPTRGFVFNAESIPDDPERPRREVIENVSRLFVHYGWLLVEE
jgi:hypothetical protein